MIGNFDPITQISVSITDNLDLLTVYSDLMTGNFDLPTGNFVSLTAYLDFLTQMSISITPYLGGLPNTSAATPVNFVSQPLNIPHLPLVTRSRILISGRLRTSAVTFAS